MKFFDKRKGASQTEYIILIVLIAISTMAAVGQYGKEIKALFQRTTAKLSLNNNDDGDDTKTSPGESGNIGGDDTTIPDSGDTNIGGDASDRKPSKSDEECQKEYKNLMNEKVKENDDYVQNLIRYTENRDNYRRLSNDCSSQASFFSRFPPGQSFYVSDSAIGVNGQRNSSGYWRNFYSGKAREYSMLANEEEEKIRREQNRHNAFLGDWNNKLRQWQQECGGRNSANSDNSNANKNDEECRKEYNNLMDEMSRENKNYVQNLIHYTENRDNYRRLENDCNAQISFFSRFPPYYRFTLYDSANGINGQQNTCTYWRNFYIRKAREYSRLANEEEEKIRREQNRHNAFFENWNNKLQQWEQECGGRN